MNRPTVSLLKNKNVKSLEPAKDAYVDQAMTVKQTAHYLRLHEQTIYRLCAMKKIPFFRLTNNGSIRLRKSAIDEWISQKTITVSHRYV